MRVNITIPNQTTAISNTIVGALLFDAVNIRHSLMARELEKQNVVDANFYKKRNSILGNMCEYYHSFGTPMGWICIFCSNIKAK